MHVNKYGRKIKQNEVDLKVMLLRPRKLGRACLSFRGSRCRGGAGAWGRAGTPERPRNGAGEWISSAARPEGGAAVSEASCALLPRLFCLTQTSLIYVSLFNIDVASVLDIYFVFVLLLDRN